MKMAVGEMIGKKPEPGATLHAFSLQPLILCVTHFFLRLHRFVCFALQNSQPVKRLMVLSEILQSTTIVLDMFHISVLIFAYNMCLRCSTFVQLGV